MASNIAPTFSVLTEDQYRSMPWKNGLGTTLEILAYEDALGLRFRISQAAVVEDGVFSIFDGLHRTLVLLSGQGMTLRHQSHSVHATRVLDAPLEIACFDGGANTSAKLHNGPIEDLNIMVRDYDTHADVRKCMVSERVKLSEAPSLLTAYFACQASRLIVTATDGEHTAISVPNKALLVFKTMLDKSELISFSMLEGRGVLIEIQSLATKVAK